MEFPTISIIVGSNNSGRTILACLKSITIQTEHTNAEIIVVDNSTDGSANMVMEEFPNVLLVKGLPNDLVPNLWGLGFERARGNFIAFTTAQCVPGNRWIEKILSGLSNGISGIGGPIDGPSGDKGLDWAVYFTRYSAFFPPGVSGQVENIAGDNAAYKHSALELCQSEMKDGFWEILVHECLIAKGHQICAAPEMRVGLGPVNGLVEMAKIRYRHGHHFGATRTGVEGFKRLVWIASSPLIAPILILRIFQRLRQQKPEWTHHFVQALPALVLLVFAWTIGEFSGYLIPHRQA